jgi:gliding motility-associated-like protein
VSIEQNILQVPVPRVSVLSHVTSCVESNGALQASVGGNTSDFIFHWYDADPGQTPDPADADFSSEIYSGLASGTYYASATSRITGCISAPANNAILDAPVFPEFEFKLEPATCEGEDGYVAIYMLNEVDIKSVVWDANGSSVNGPTLEGIPAGTYSVTVTSALGCSKTRNMELGTEIRPYNGISRNGDGQNEIFHINCIDTYPNNLVKIFNRAGTLVYEAERYDNIDVYFDGKSNRGISLIGSNLPDGTYFYVIDKRNGSKPIAGYLEIVN